MQFELRSTLKCLTDRRNTGYGTRVRVSKIIARKQYKNFWSGRIARGQRSTGSEFITQRKRDMSLKIAVFYDLHRMSLPSYSSSRFNVCALLIKSLHKHGSATTVRVQGYPLIGQCHDVFVHDIANISSSLGRNLCDREPLSFDSLVHKDISVLKTLKAFMVKPSFFAPLQP